MSNRLCGDRPNPYHRADSLADLLDWHDVDFIRCAYVTILGRQPDPNGEKHYLRRVRRGHFKLAIISELRRSKEGRSHDPGIAGLDWALRRAAWGRLPIIGRAFRRSRSDANEVSGVGDALRSIINANGVIQEALLSIDQRLKSLEAELSKAKHVTHVPSTERPSAISRSELPGRPWPMHTPLELTKRVAEGENRSPMAKFFHQEVIG